MRRVAVFGYASLASPESASQTIGRPVEFAGVARLQGWRRAWTLGREQAESEKTFARGDGSIPRFCLGLNVEPDPDAPAPNGVLIELSEAELDRLDIREIRYDRMEVTGSIEGKGLPERIVTYSAKPFHFAPEPPEDSIILATYAAAVDRGFESLGPGELDHDLATTPYPVDRHEASLVIDNIPEGNPRAW